MFILKMKPNLYLEICEETFDKKGKIIDVQYAF